MRTQIPSDIAADVLFSSDRTCCVCQIIGKPVQIHHLDDNPNNHNPDNLATLCLDCHNETQIQGGFGRKLNAELIRKYRTDWTSRVRVRREMVDKLFVQARFAQRISKKDDLNIGFLTNTFATLDELIQALPFIRATAYEQARVGMESGVTAEMVSSGGDIIRVLQKALTLLAEHYPLGHYDNLTPEQYIEETISSRASWHYLRHSTSGLGKSGTIVSVLTTASVIADAENMVEELVTSLTGTDLTSESFDFIAWKNKWHASNAKVKTSGGLTSNSS